MPPGNRPKEVHTKHLTELERFRVRTLYFDAGMSKKRIEEVTGYSNSQIRTAIRAKSAAIPHRTGRPRKQRFGQRPADNEADDEAGPSQSQGSAAEGEDSSAAAATAAAAPNGSSSNGGSFSSSDPTTLALQASQHQHPTTTTTSSSSPPASFNRLPASLRRYIWTLVLTYPPSSPAPLSITWWVDPLPRSPYLVGGVFPEHWATHWKAYLAYRAAPARVLCAVSREARRAVVDTFAAVWTNSNNPQVQPQPRSQHQPNRDPASASSHPHHQHQHQHGGAGAYYGYGYGLGAAVAPFLWVDPRHDNIYCEDPGAAQNLPALLDRSRAAVLPHLMAGAQQQQQQTSVTGINAALPPPAPSQAMVTAGNFVGNGGA
ncbi:hypothetical protein F4821DRAFT_260375 [Hypoxylon rubiginosum]|uniref:Uncharacterized protein n=1 Tax=Hypoxylon rubiginosum TaxID=110542 RepID=A0ACC0D0L9_9PEZI|nr:hypothetical protein F4821DRAFT_260375 [Hypoxylon rubiginosum]